jgi:RNAse H-fold protein YqgF
MKTYSKKGIKNMKILSVDFGEKRTGIAISDKNEMLASPHSVITEWDKSRLIQKIIDIALENEIELIVVGYPKNMNGTVGERAEKCSEFANKLENQSNIKTVLWDERITTVSAIGFLNTANVRGKKRKEKIDSVAAAIILQDFLDFRKNTNEHK